MLTKRPTEAVSILGALLNLAIAFGVNLTGDQVSALNVVWLVVVVPGVTAVVAWLHHRRGNVQVWVNRENGGEGTSKRPGVGEP